MKSFKIDKSNFEFEVIIQEEPQIEKNYRDEYSINMVVENVLLDGVELPKDSQGRVNSAEIRYTYLPAGKEKALLLTLDKEAAQVVVKKAMRPGRHKAVHIICSDEFTLYYLETFLPTAEKKINRLKEEKTAKIQAAFDALQEDTVMDVHYHTSYGFSISRHEAAEHPWFKTALPDIKKAKLGIPDQYIVNFDQGDYSLSYTYKIPFGVIKQLHQEARGILEPIERRKEEEQAAQEKRRASLKMEIVDEGKKWGGEGHDLFAFIRLTDTATLESLEFKCWNIFDAGYFIKANYLIDGIKGEDAGWNGDEWRTYKEDEGWVTIRKLTDFEKRCMEYISEFSPIPTRIRL